MLGLLLFPSQARDPGWHVLAGAGIAFMELDYGGARLGEHDMNLNTREFH